MHPIHTQPRSISLWQPALCLFVLLVLGGVTRADTAGIVRIQNADAIPLVHAFSVYMNHGTGLTLEDLVLIDQQGGFEQAAEDQGTATNFGLTQAEVWLRLQLISEANTPQRRLLEIAHASLDQVDMYLLPESGPAVIQHSGDLLAFSTRPVQHRHHVFDLLLEPGSAYTLYLRVMSQGTLTVPATLWQADALWRADQTAYSVLSLYYGLMLALLVWNLFMYVSLRDPLYLVYVGFIFFSRSARRGCQDSPDNSCGPEIHGLII